MGLAIELRVLSATMDRPLPTKLTCCSAWRPEPGCWICLVLGGVVLISLAVGIGAVVTALGRWMGGVCGDWAPPGWKDDPRCDGSLYDWMIAGLATAKWSAAALCLASAWLVVRKRRWLRQTAQSFLYGELSDKTGTNSPTESAGGVDDRKHESAHGTRP